MGSSSRSLLFCGANSSLNLGSDNFPVCKSRVLIFRGGTNRRFAVTCNSSEPPSPRSSESGRKWMLGMVLTVVVPFLTTRGGPLRRIQYEIKSKVETIENLVEEVEEVAEGVEKLTEMIEENLPDGQLKSALQKIEDVAEQIEEEAELIEDLVDKVKEAEEQLDSAIESSIHAKESKKRKKSSQLHSTSNFNRK